MCGRIVAPSAGSGLLHPASTAAHKTAVPTIKVFSLHICNPFPFYISRLFPDYCANFLTCDSRLYRISQRITPQGAVASHVAAAPYYVIADRSSVNVFRISFT